MGRGNGLGTKAERNPTPQTPTPVLYISVDSLGRGRYNTAFIICSDFTFYTHFPVPKPSRKLLSFNFAMGHREVNCMISPPQLILAHKNKTCTSRNISCYAWREICQSLCLPSFGGTFQSSFKERQAKKVIWRSLNRRRLHEQKRAMQ